MSPAPVLAALLATLSLLPLAAQDGLYADFDASTFGDLEDASFTVKLDIATSGIDTAAAPRLVANFIRLAEGSAPWVDEATGIVKQEPFFDGLKFYKLSYHDRLYFGSRSGTGLDGPGYILQDDFRSGPTSNFGLYMDNDGPNTNGCRFFISIPLTAAVNSRYSRIGEVITTTINPGQNGRVSVTALTEGVVDDQGFATFPALIKSVTIRRVGPVANGFDEGAWELPAVTTAPLKVAQVGGLYRLLWAAQPGSSVLYHTSADLFNWFGPFRGWDAPGTGVLGADLTNTMNVSPKVFFRGARASYPFVPSAQVPLPNASILINHPTIGPIRYDFDASGQAGIWVQNNVPQGTFTVVSQTMPGPYIINLEVTGSNGLPHFYYTLHCDLEYSDNSVKANSYLTGGIIQNVGGTPQLTSPFEGAWIYFPPPG